MPGRFLCRVGATPVVGLSLEHFIGSGIAAIAKDDSIYFIIAKGRCRCDRGPAGKPARTSRDSFPCQWTSCRDFGGKQYHEERRKSQI